MGDEDKGTDPVTDDNQMGVVTSVAPEPGEPTEDDPFVPHEPREE